MDAVHHVGERLVQPVPDHVGDAVAGTDGGRLVPTTVLAHWETVRPAWRLTLVGGEEVIASGDHERQRSELGDGRAASFMVEINRGFVTDPRQREAFGAALRLLCSPGRLPLRNRLFSLVDVPDLRLMPALFPGLKNVWTGAAPVWSVAVLCTPEGAPGPKRAPTGRY